MNYKVPKLTVAASIALSLAGMDAHLAQAVTYDINVSILSGPLTNQLFSGFVSFEDSSLSGIGDESLPITNFQFEFLGVEYTEADDPTATVDFFDSDFLGLNFAAVDPSTNDSFSFVSGMFAFPPVFPPSINDAFFAYNLPQPPPPQGGEGQVTYTKVPEPSSIIGLLALASLGLVWLSLLKFRR